MRERYLVFLGQMEQVKTTLISMLTGVLKPDSGSVIIGGYDLKKDVNKVKKMVSLVPKTLRYI